MTLLSPPRILDLFSGAGGMALGFEAAGGRTIGAVDFDAPSARTFSGMFSSEAPVVLGGPQEGDMRNLDMEDLLRKLSGTPDVIVGGPPCQGFSRVGRAKQASLQDQDERDRRGVRDPDRNELYRYFLDAVKTTRPLAFVMENVPAMRGSLGVDIAGRIATEATFLGYNVRYFLLNAAWYGVPQYRWRIFFVGLRSDLGHRAIPEPPPRTHEALDTPLEGMPAPEDPRMIWGDQIPSTVECAPPTTAKEALGDLPRLVAHLKGEKPVDCPLPLRRRPSRWARELRNWPGRSSPDEVVGNWYRFTVRDFPIFREMAHGDRYPEALAIAHRLFRERLAQLRAAGAAPRPNTKSYEVLQREFIPPYRNDAFDEKWRKLIPDEPSWTLTAHLSKDSYSHIHYQGSQARTISIREAARLQSFPDSFVFSGNFGDQFRQIGNAVPPLMAKALAKQLFFQLQQLATQSRAERNSKAVGLSVT